MPSQVGYVPNKPFICRLENTSNKTFTIQREDNECGILYVKVTEEIEGTKIDTEGEEAFVGEEFYKSTSEDNGTKAISLYLGGWKYQSDSEQIGKYNGKKTTNYVTKGGSTTTDTWDKGVNKYGVGQEDPYNTNENRKLITDASDGYAIYTYGGDNGRNEFTEDVYWGRYEFYYVDENGEHKQDEREAHKITINGEEKTYNLFRGGSMAGNPFTVPCIGCYVKIEPEVNGRVKLHVLQNASIDYDAALERADDKKKTGTLLSGASWRPVFFVDEQGTRFGETDVTATTKTEITIGREDETALTFNNDAKKHVYCITQVEGADGKMVDGEILKKYDLKNDKNYTGYVDSYYFKEDTKEDYDYVYVDNVKTYVRHITFKESITTFDWLEEKLGDEKYNNFFTQKLPVYYTDDTYQTEAPFGTTDYVNEVEVWPEHVRGDGSDVTDVFYQRVWGPKYTGDGWIVISKGYVDYEFDVKAGKSYYVFSNDTRFGFCGYEFTAKEQPTATLTFKEDGTYTVGEGTPTGIKEANKNASTGIPAGTYASVTLERSFHSGWNAICLPFSVTENKMREWFGTEDEDTEDYELVTYNGAEDLGNDKLKAHFFRHVYQDIVAGIPYMLYIPEGAKAIRLQKATFNNITIEDNVEKRTFSISCDNMPDPTHKSDLPQGYGYGYDTKSGKAQYDENNKSIGIGYLYEKGQIDDYTSVGNYTPVYPKRGSYLVLKEGIQLYDEATSVKLNGFRSYLNPGFDPGSFSSLARIASTNFTQMFDEQEDWDATVINDLLSEELGFFNRPANVYSVSGQLIRANSTSLVGLPKGIYIVNGKKYLVK
ncbi:MAG: hypothetical protein J1F40_05640 [Prevotellaceae bacterium]|nr:hypothetical protein [Prevotellaceae bacterium]